MTHLGNIWQTFGVTGASTYEKGGVKEGFHVLRGKK
jgi:hypothetical protein